jgi:hypothetical protein
VKKAATQERYSPYQINFLLAAGVPTTIFSLTGRIFAYDTMSREATKIGPRNSNLGQEG